jgi:hypothetical protein
LFGVTRATDQGVTALLTKCPCLDHLRLHDMVGVTDVIVDVIIRCCPQMRRLAVGLCPGITDSALRRLEAANKTLELETSHERPGFQRPLPISLIEDAPIP